jgi:hypothetical protein
LKVIFQWECCESWNCVRRLRRRSEFDGEILKHRFSGRSGRRFRTGTAARWSRPSATSDRHPIGAAELSTGRAALFGKRKDCDPVPGSAASAKPISAERECEPVFFMTAARWFSTVRWLMPKKVYMSEAYH